MAKPGLSLKFNLLGVVTFLVLGALGVWWGSSMESAWWRIAIYAGTVALAFVVSFVCIRR